MEVPILKDEHLQRDFQKTGYARVPLLSPAEVEHLLAEVAKLRPNDGFAPSGASRFSPTYHCSFLDSNIDYKRKTFQLIKSVFDLPIQRHLTGYRILNANFYVKPAGTGEFAIHQNWPAVSDLNDTTVTVWCPLVDVVESNGALQVVAGSHKILPHIEGPTAPAYFTNFKDALIQKYLKPIPMKAGEGVIFDDSLIHWSARNGSEQPRIAIQILCVPVNAVPVYFYKVSEREFEMIHADSDFYIESQLTDLLQRQSHWKSLGFVKNRNRLITETEFAKLLQEGDDIRRRGS